MASYCWMLCRWWLCRPLVYWCLLSMADGKLQRRRLTTSRQRQQPVTTPRHRTTTPEPTMLQPTTSRLPSVTPLPATTPRLTSDFCLQLHTHNRAGQLLRSTYKPLLTLLPTTPKYYSAPNYYISKALESYTTTYNVRFEIFVLFWCGQILKVIVNWNWCLILNGKIGENKILMRVIILYDFSTTRTI